MFLHLCETGHGKCYYRFSNDFDDCPSDTVKSIEFEKSDDFDGDDESLANIALGLVPVSIDQWESQRFIDLKMDLMQVDLDTGDEIPLDAPTPPAYSWGIVFYDLDTESYGYTTFGRENGLYGESDNVLYYDSKGEALSNMIGNPLNL